MEINEMKNQNIKQTFLKKSEPAKESNVRFQFKENDKLELVI